MKNLNSFLGRASMLLAVGSILSLPSSTGAAPITLNVDPLQSSITLSGGVFGLTYSAQSAGSLVDAWGGQITGDLTGGTWTFAGGSTINAVLNPGGPYSTAPAPWPTGGDNYGATATGVVGLYGLSTVNGAYRNLSLDITSGSTGNGLTFGGAFTFIGATDRLDWGAMTENAGPFPGQVFMAGKTGPNTSASLVSWDGTTLTMPVTFQTTGANGLIENWVGTIVATVPEPSTLALGVLGLVGFLVASRNRSRARGI